MEGGRDGDTDEELPAHHARAEHALVTNVCAKHYQGSNCCRGPQRNVGRGCRLRRPRDPTCPDQWRTHCCWQCECRHIRKCIYTYICECVAYIFDSNVSIDSASKLYQPITMCSVSGADRGQLGTPGRACPQAEQAIAPRRESAWTEMSQDTRSRPYVL